MNPTVGRILDANANRAREALRVVEDYARFALDDESLCAPLKRLRHDFATVTGPFVADAILHRDTPGDVGTATKTPTEQSRADVAHVVTAAGKRLGEALRTIEEFLKTEDPARAAQVEALRYRFYDLERRVALTLGGATAGGGGGRFANVRLYVLVTESLCKRPWLDVCEQAILGGADCLQLREKGLESGEYLRRARPFVALCERHGVIGIVNDRVGVAIAAGAHGIHVGQTDLPALEARKQLGSGGIVGVSTHNIEQARQAVRDGADYIGVGPFFKSATKPRDFVAGPDYARQVAESVPVPAVAIAGITEANVDEVLATGMRAVAVSSAVCASDDPRAAAERLKRKLAP